MEEERRKKAELLEEQNAKDKENSQLEKEGDADDSDENAGKNPKEESMKPNDGKMDEEGEGEEEKKDDEPSLDWLETESAESRKERMLKLIQECKNNPEKF